MTSNDRLCPHSPCLHYIHCLFSRAILCYLVNKYGQEEPRKSQLYPADPETRALVDRLLFFDNGTLYKNIVDYFVSINLPSTKWITPYRSLQHPQLMSGEEADERKANALKQSLDYLDLFLAASPYVATSHLTIADFSILASVTQLEGMEYKITAYP